MSSSSSSSSSAAAVVDPQPTPLRKEIRNPYASPFKPNKARSLSTTISSPIITTTNNNNNSNNNNASDATKSTTTAVTQQRTLPFLPLSVNDSVQKGLEALTNRDAVSMIDRLPSRNVSYTSCEILTLPEAASLLSSVNDNDNKKSIRVTGEIIYINTDDMFIILGDALTQPKVATTSTPVFQQQQQQKQSPLLGTKRKFIKTGNGLGSTKFITSKKKTAAAGSRGENTTISIMDKLLRDKHDYSLLIVDLSHVMEVWKHIHCGPNDLLMVMGEVVCVDNTNKDRTVLNHALHHSAIQQQRQQQQQRQDGESDGLQMKVLQARVIRNATGTDLNLWQEALLLRRHYLQQPSLLNNK